MRIDQLTWSGLWIRYRDSARPVEMIDGAVYSFENPERECLVSRPEHVTWLLQTGRYEVVGVELAEETLIAHPRSAERHTPSEPSKAGATKPASRTRRTR